MVDMKLNDVVKLIRGTPGTIVRLGVIPSGQERAEDLQDHAGQDRAEGPGSPRRDLRGRQEAGR